MHVFVQKILKIELLFLFFLALFSITSFYYGESLPDNYLSISSYADHIVSVNYLFSSAIAFVGYYVGPWALFLFFFFSLFYGFLFSKRDFFLDIFSVVFLSLGMLFSFSFFAPDFLGNGVKFLLKSFFFGWELLSASALCFTLFLAAAFRSSFKEVCMRLFLFLGKLPRSILQLFFLFNPVRLYSFFIGILGRIREKIQVRLPSFLKGVSSKKRRMDSLRNSIIDGEGHLEKGGGLEKREELHFTPVSRRKKESPLPPQESFLARKEREGQKRVYSQDEEGKKEAIKNYKLKNELGNEKKYYDIVTTLIHKSSKKDQPHPDSEYFEKIIDSIQSTLNEFKIVGEIVNILKGPVVDTFELELGAGVKVSKVTNAENEISMALLGAPIRIVYPMLGRATVGIEVPRNPREVIFLDDVLNSAEFKKSRHRLPVAMGKDAFGVPLIVDLASMPHMLVAGATGAGKSVFINTLLVSLLVKKSPSQMKLILIDPKQLELALYANLPHLIMPVVTNAKMASLSLLWACQEMERRYSILKEFGVRNIEGFNEKLKKATSEMLAKIHPYYEDAGEDHYELPYLTIIVDEFADLILTKAGKDIENNICRLAAKARAAGLHLVLATQRPSVDVITGLIKSNFPTRVSFRVTSSQDSRTILNSIGAEKLLGKGDMLYRHGTSNLRVHSAYVDEEEIEGLAAELASLPHEFHGGAMEFLENGDSEEKDPYAFGSHLSGGETSSDEEYFKLAVKTVVEHRTASASMLQRRLKIGYNRAANLIEEMEQKGIVGPAEGSRRRKVLYGLEDLTHL